MNSSQGREPLQEPHLFIIPSVPVWNHESSLCFDRKFYDGIIRYLQYWPGRITCIMATSRSERPDFGVVEKLPDELPFSCIALGDNEPVTGAHVKNATLVMASGDAHDQLHISRLCNKAHIKCLYVIEYIPETRYQIASFSTKNPLVLLRRLLYIRSYEQKRIAAFKLCDGLQCNGTPAYDHYNSVANRLLYFDTRVSNKQLIGDAELETRLDTLNHDRPLRLAFSGRLIRMKGADHLVKLAQLLKKKGLRFQLTIYGTGDLDSDMRSEITTRHLENEVSMPGAVDFSSRLIPAIKANVDLFVCLHRQSDPSCTYLETLSCGVPIVGYKNRAFAGIMELADIGWGTTMNDLDGIASIIGTIDSNRKELAEKSRNSVKFARLHDFETTYRNRIEHLLSVNSPEP
ncbi:MAG TPA: glycosyltransferase [Chlorobaculum sp.]|nr:glycosyltransferase [Chlorobaculum sp.]